MASFANPELDTYVLRLILSSGTSTSPSIVFANDLTKGLSWDTNGLHLSGLATPINASDAATKQYVDDSSGSITFPILADDGSNTAPSYSFSSNTNYGLYLNPSNPSVNVSLNGTDQIVMSDQEIDIQTSFVDMIVDQFFVEGISGGKSIVTDTNSNIALGRSTLSTSATDGYPNIPKISGTPTGTPTTMSGNYAPIVFDSSANKLWIWNGSAWKFVTLS